MSEFAKILDSGVTIKFARGPVVNGFETYELELSKVGSQPHTALLDAAVLRRLGDKSLANELRIRNREFGARL